MLLSAMRANSLGSIFLPVLVLEPLLCFERLSAGRFLTVDGNSEGLVRFRRRRLRLDHAGGSLQQCIVRMLLGSSNSALAKRTHDSICFVFLYSNADDPFRNTVFRFLEYLRRWISTFNSGQQL